MDLGQDGKLWNGRNGRSGKLSHSNDVVGACICSIDVNVCDSAHRGCVVNGSVVCGLLSIIITTLQSGMTNGQEVRKLYVLHAHIPILEDAHHSGWTLALVDTPGFGEANVEHVTSHADMLFSTSTAYLYMMDSSNLEDAVDAANIQQLYQYDKGIQLCIYDVHKKMSSSIILL